MGSVPPTPISTLTHYSLFYGLASWQVLGRIEKEKLGVNFILAIPLEFRLAMVLLLGTVIGGQINRGIYRLAYHRRHIGPWSPPAPGAPPRRWYDRLPVLGWISLARESKLHGPGYWLRPLMIELFFGCGLALLYWWEITGGLTPDVWPGMPPMKLPDQADASIHAQFLAHVILITLMTVASFIDIDEKLIPDEITVIGTLIGLTLAVLLPMSLLPIPGADVGTWDFLKLTSPLPWPAYLDGPRGLLTGLACFFAWWLAILDLRLIGRRGAGKAITYLLARIRRRLWPRPGHLHEGSPIYLAILLVASAGIATVWAIQGWWGIASWRALLSSLVGMAFGGGLIWAVRIVGTWALKQEAMGFGDVTLVAMMGSFLGWQSCLILFFLAPFAGVAIAVGQWLLTRQHEIWFGPFLCIGATITIVCWAWLWMNYGMPIFAMGRLVPALLVFCMGAMAIMLLIYRVFKERMAPPPQPSAKK